MAMPRTAYARPTRRLSRLLVALTIYSLIASSLLPLRSTSAVGRSATPQATRLAVAATHSTAPTATPRTPAILTSAGFRTSVYLPLIRSRSGPARTPTPTSTPSATPISTPSPTPTNTPTSTPSATSISTPSPTNTPTSTPSATPAPDTEPPTAPTNLRLNERTDTTISLVWDAATDNVAVTGYEIFNGPALAATTSEPAGMVTGLAPETVYTFTVRAKDAAGNLSEVSTPLTLRTKRADGLPFDPATIASPSDRTITSDFAADTRFLYTGVDAIQAGVTAGTIDARRVAVLRGRVHARDGSTLSGVKITVLGHPEYGQTESRGDGVFDLAVNGGGLLTLTYTRDGYLLAQRQVTAPWRDYAWLPDVVLIPLDPHLTELNLTGESALQIAQGSVVSDTDGVRQATLFFPEHVTATLVMPDGTNVPLTTLHVRATEYTVGASGPKAMPGPLPANSGYTYAVEFSADEAIAAGVKTVRFSQPLINYTENFLGFPVGGIVPTGYYDRDRAAWIPSNNGRVIKIVGVTGGMADLDITGDDVADDATILGVTAAERQQLAASYPAGRELWRVPIPHFTPWDHNWPFGPPFDAIGPNGGAPRGDDPLDDPCKRTGSIVECQNQTLGEVMEVSGTPFHLHYQSDRVAGRRAVSSLEIPLSGSDLPASLDRIELEISVAGRRFSGEFAPAPNQSYDFTWDGEDAYGRELQGAQAAVVSINYVYPLVYRTPATDAQSFGRPGNVAIVSLSRTGAEASVGRVYQGAIGPFDVHEQGLGGWTLDVHHTYDPNVRTLYLGNGTRRTAERVDPAIVTVAGFCTRATFYGGGYYGDGGPALNAVLNRPAGLAVGPDGSFYIADQDNQRIRRVGPDGIISTVAGNGTAGYSGDGGPATAAALNRPSGVAVGPDGSLYIADQGNQRIRRVDLNGIISTVAGNGFGAGYGDGGPATSARLLNPAGVAVGPDGTLYIADTDHERIRRVDLNGIITTIAGTGSRTSTGDGGQARLASIGDPTGVALGADGSLFIVDTYNHHVRRVAPSGIITTVAGGGTDLLDGVPATTASLYQPYSVAVGADGSLYIADQMYNRIRVVRPNGFMTTLAGNGVIAPLGENGPATAASLYHPLGVAVGPNGDLYLADTLHHCVRQVGVLERGSNLSDYFIPSEDGHELYQFDHAGRHLHTLNALTGDTIYSFAYDAAGHLTQIADHDGRITTIERDAGGAPLAILGPDGQRTTFTLNAEDNLASVTNPAGETTRFTYTPEGLLTGLTDPRGGSHAFEYDAQGRLARDTNPVGGFTTLSRSDDDDGYTVTITNALSDTTTMQVETLPSGDQRRVSTAPNGATTTTLIKSNGSRIVTDARGNVTTTVEGPDPRFGMQAPFVKSVTISTADGQTYYTLTADRRAALTNRVDPWSIQSQTDTVTVNGRTTTTVANALARTITTTDPAGKQTMTTLDARGRPVREETTNLAPKQYLYDSQGRLIALTEGTGDAARTTTLAYNPQGYLASTTDPLSGTTIYSYDLAGRVLSRTLPTGHRLTFTYNAAGNRTGSTDPQGVLTTYEYDLQNRLTATTLDPGGRAVRTEYAYDLAGNLLTRVEDAGARRLYATTRYSYTPIGTAGAYTVNRATDPLGRQTQYSYTPSGEISSISDPLNHTTVFSYTAQGWRSAVTTPSGRTTVTTYNDDGQVVSVTDPRGSTTTFAYDSASRLKTVTAGVAAVDDQPAVNQTLTYDYDVNGRVTRVTDPRGEVSTRSYDAFGRLIEERDPLGNSISYAYDALDRLTLRTVGSAPGEIRQTAYTYDAAGRLLAEQADPNGLNLLTQYHYARPGESDSWKPLEIVDPNGNSTIFHYNSLGLQDTTTDALGHTWAFEYDNLGRPIEQIDPLGHATNSTFDALGRKTGLTQDGRSAHWNYDADGTLASATDFMGRTTTYSYDSDRRLIGIDYPAGTADVSYTYDASDNLASMVDGLGTTTYTYDAINRLLTRTRDGRSVTYTYAADDQLAQIDYWGRGAVQYAYDAPGRLTGLTPWSNTPTSYSYRGDGLLAGQTRGNGVATAYGYDGAGRLRDLLHQRGTTTLQDIQYVLDPNGNRTQQTDDDGVTTYSYDALDRLTQVSYPSIPGGPSAASANYDLDPVGNRLSDGTTSFTYDPSDRISNPGYSYDADGNLLDDGTTAYAYDAANRLIQTVTRGITTTYGYDGNGNLIRETVNGVTTDFVVDERGDLPRILGEVRSNGTETLYAYGPEGFAAQQSFAGDTPQDVQYPLLDGLGSVRHLTDGSGTIILSRGYDAFGAIRYTAGTAQTALGFTGERMGAVDGTIYLHARHYSPALGRFLQRDAFEGFAARPQSLNRYAYAENNPARFTDPSGHCPFCLAIAAGAVIGAGIEYGSQVYQNFQQGESGWDAFTDVQADKIGYAAVQGAVAGGVGFVAGPLVGALSETGLLGSVAGGALEGMTAGSLGQIAMNLLRGCSWDTNLLQALTSGGLSGGLGGGLGWGLREVGKTIQGTLGAVAGDPSDRVIQVAKDARPLPGYYDVIAHGREDAIKLFINGVDDWSSAREVAEWILKQEDYIPGTPVRLLSCNAGGVPKCCGDPIAAQIANELRVKILAANAYIKPNPDGTLDLVEPVFDLASRRWQYPLKGEWLHFDPAPLAIDP